MSVLSIYDLDHFKRVNDTYGHEKGDEVLVQAARAIRARIRSNAQVFRYGGEEFASIERWRMKDLPVLEGRVNATRDGYAEEMPRLVLDNCGIRDLCPTLSMGVGIIEPGDT